MWQLLGAKANIASRLVRNDPAANLAEPPLHPLIETLTLGHVSEVKLVLASALAAAAVYQAGLMAVGYGVVKAPFLAAGAASRAHRALGDAIVVVTLLVAAMCVGFFGWEAERSDAHVPVALALIGVLAVKVAVVRWAPRLGFLLPALGVTVLGLFVATWLTVAPELLR